MKTIKYAIEIDTQKGVASIKSLTAETQKSKQATSQVGKSGKPVFSDIGKVAKKASIAIGGITVALAGIYKGLQSLQNSKRLQLQLQHLFSAPQQSVHQLRQELQELVSLLGSNMQDTIQATNSISKAFDISFSRATTIIRQGFLSGADASGQMLESLKEYPHIMHQAGISAMQMMDILSLSAKQGIFSDKGIDAVKEGFLSLREMTDATKVAISGLGLNAQKMQQDINSGNLSYLQAMQKISKKMKDQETSAQAIGAIYADVFRGAGEDAANFVMELDQIDGKLDEAGEAAQDLENISTILAGMSNIVSELMRGLDSLAGVFLRAFGNSAIENVKNYATEVEKAKTALQSLTEVQVEKKLLELQQALEKEKRALIEQEESVASLAEAERLRFEQFKKNLAYEKQSQQGSDIYATQNQQIKVRTDLEYTRYQAIRDYQSQVSDSLKNANSEISDTKGRIASLTSSISAYQEALQNIPKKTPKKPFSEDLSAIKKYYEKVKFLDANYYSWKEQEIKKEVSALKISEAKKVLLIRANLKKLKDERWAYQKDQMTKIKEVSALFSTQMNQNQNIQELVLVQDAKKTKEAFDFKIGCFDHFISKTVMGWENFSASTEDQIKVATQFTEAMTQEIDKVFFHKQSRSNAEIELDKEAEKEAYTAEKRKLKAEAKNYKRGSKAYRKNQLKLEALEKKHQRKITALRAETAQKNMSFLAKSTQVMRAGLQEAIKMIANKVKALAIESVIMTVPFPANLVVAPIAGATAYSLVSAIGGAFADGGYTGQGGKYDVAGVVHRGELVLEQEITEKNLPQLLGLRKKLQDGYSLQSLLRPEVTLPSVPPTRKMSLASGGVGDAEAGLLLPQILETLQAVNQNLAALEINPKINITSNNSMEDFVVAYESEKKNMMLRGEL